MLKLYHGDSVVTVDIFKNTRCDLSQAVTLLGLIYLRGSSDLKRQPAPMVGRRRKL